MTIIPAYGRDYKSAKAVKADWQAGKDFLIADMFHPDHGRYVSIRDNVGKVIIRYDKMRKVTPC